MADPTSPPAALLERAEHYIYLATALILVLAAAALLAFAAVEVVQEVLVGEYSLALLQLLDRALLVLMLAEIIYTVRSIARPRISGRFSSSARPSESGSWMNTPAAVNTSVLRTACQKSGSATTLA